MSKLLIRWTFGEWAEQKMDEQALSLLRNSIQFAQRLFPEADLLLCHNQLIWYSAEIEAISREYGVNLFDCRPHLPTPFQSSDTSKNSWWKYAPARLNPAGFEIVLDNDVILWRRPAIMETWFKEGGLLALGERRAYLPRRALYGEYTQEMAEIDPYLDFNAGILGWPPYYQPSIEQVTPQEEFFYTEQGFSAVNFIRYPGPKHLIPYSEVPLMNTILVNPPYERLVQKYSGGHFCQCNFGVHDYWRKKYQRVVEAHLKQLV